MAARWWCVLLIGRFPGCERLSTLGGTCLSGPLHPVGSSTPLQRARQACPSDTWRDLLVRSAPPICASSDEQSPRASNSRAVHCGNSQNPIAGPPFIRAQDLDFFLEAPEKDPSYRGHCLRKEGANRHLSPNIGGRRLTDRIAHQPHDASVTRRWLNRGIRRVLGSGSAAEVFAQPWPRSDGFARGLP